MPLQIAVRRTLLTVAVVAVVAFAGCSTDPAPTPVPTAPASTTSSPPSSPPSATPSAPSATPSSGEADGATGAIPDDFPLAQGLVDDDETQVSGPSRDGDGIDLRHVCGLQAWPGPAVDRLVAHLVGPEVGVVRELVTYRNARAARAVLARIRDAVDGCPIDTGVTRPHASRFVRFANPDPTAAHPATVFAEGLPGNRPGGAVYAFLRVGNAVLGTEEGGEFTRESSLDGARRLLADDRDMVARMCVFSASGC